MTNRSESIAKLSEALAKAQGEITGALKDSANPFFKSKYADLASCWDACRAPLAKNGLAVIQLAESDSEAVILTTVLSHLSGEWIEGRLRVTPKDATPQAFGSALTYARRYALTAMVGVAQVDDDGNSASGKGAINPRGDMTDAPNAEVSQDHGKRLRQLFEAGDRAGLLEHVAALQALGESTYIAAFDSSRFNTQEKVKFRAALAEARKAANEPEAAHG